MKQNITNNEATLLERGNAAADGLDDLAEALGMSPDVAARLREAGDNMIAARTGLQLGRGTLRTRKAAVQAAMAAARQFVTLLREILKPHLGNQYSQAWDVVGFVGSLAMPQTTAVMQMLLTTAKKFLTDNPTRENGALLITAAQADLLLTQLQAAVAALNAQLTTAANQRKTRKTNRVLLRLRLFALVADLKTRLDPLDDRWTTLGLNKPGARETPGVPEGFTATLVGENDILMKWPATERADQYRVWMRVVGPDTELASHSLRTELDCLLEELPRNSVVELALSAMNNGGESAKSTIVTVITQ